MKTMFGRRSAGNGCAPRPSRSSRRPESAGAGPRSATPGSSGRDGRHAASRTSPATRSRPPGRPDPQPGHVPSHRRRPVSGGLTLLRSVQVTCHISIPRPGRHRVSISSVDGDRGCRGRRVHAAKLTRFDGSLALWQRAGRSGGAPRRRQPPHRAGPTAAPISRSLSGRALVVLPAQAGTPRRDRIHSPGDARLQGAAAGVERSEFGSDVGLAGVQGPTSSWRTPSVAGSSSGAGRGNPAFGGPVIRFRCCAATRRMTHTAVSMRTTCRRRAPA